MVRNGREKTNILAGVLLGDTFECNCTVALVTRLTQNATPGVGVWTSIRIASAEKSPPDGTYRLAVHGRVFNIDRTDGKWATLIL
jgi:hypothetical protein